MNQIIVNTLDSARLMNRLKSARQEKTVHASDAEKLIAELNRALLCAPQEIPADVVTMNSVVRIYIPSMNKRREIQLVYPESANLKENKISIFAPIATALLGYRKGDEVVWNVPSGNIKIIVEEILFQPEATGNFDL